MFNHSVTVLFHETLFINHKGPGKLNRMIFVLDLPINRSSPFKICFQITILG